MKKVNALIIFSLFLVLLVLFSFSKNKNSLSQISADVPCLLPNLPLVMHLHSELSIEIDGKIQNIPNTIGIEKSCERAIHMHNDTMGKIHVESQTVRDYTLGDFFSVWGEKIEKENYDLIMTVNNQPSKESSSVILKNDQKIKLVYTAKK